MKQHIKFVFGLSLMALALAGCGKKEEPKQSKPSQTEVAQPVVNERPPVVCDDANIKNNIANSVTQALLQASMAELGNAKNISALEQHLKSRLAQTQIDVQNATYQNGECQGELHITLDANDVAAANKAFASARVASLDERAVESGVSLLGSNRLVSNFVYQADGEAIAMNTSNPAITLASKALAQATIATFNQNQATARRHSGSSYQAPTITPPPVVAPAPVPRNQQYQAPQPQQPQTQRRNPTPETAKLRDEDVPARERQSEPTPSHEPPISASEREKVQSQEAQAQPKSEPKAQSKPQPKPEAKAEAQPKEQPKAPAKDDRSEITIVESDEIY